jgi:hypothetical protein
MAKPETFVRTFVSIIVSYQLIVIGGQFKERGKEAISREKCQVEEKDMNHRGIDLWTGQALSLQNDRPWS